MRVDINKIILALTFFLGLTGLLSAQEKEAPKIFRDSTKHSRYTLYTETPQVDTASAVISATPTPINVDTIETTKTKSPASKPVYTESSMPDSAVMESIIAEEKISKPGISESGLPVSESGAPITESELPVTTQDKSQMSESGLPVSSQPVIPETTYSETETQISNQRVSESGSPVITARPAQESPSAVSDPVIIEYSDEPQTETPADVPVSTQRFVSEENKAKVSPEGTRHDWSNPPGYTGEFQIKNVKTKKHTLRKNKHKYRPHHKYSHKKKRIHSPKF
jgi:hypothetical protein